VEDSPEVAKVRAAVKDLVEETTQQMRLARLRVSKLLVFKVIAALVAEDLTPLVHQLSLSAGLHGVPTSITTEPREWTGEDIALIVNTIADLRGIPSEDTQKRSTLQGLVEGFTIDFDSDEAKHGPCASWDADAVNAIASEVASQRGYGDDAAKMESVRVKVASHPLEMELAGLRQTTASESLRLLSAHNLEDQEDVAAKRLVDDSHFEGRKVDQEGSGMYPKPYLPEEERDEISDGGDLIKDAVKRNSFFPEPTTQKPGHCIFCTPDPSQGDELGGIKRIHYTNVEVLHRFITERGMITNRRQNHNCAKHQRQLRKAIKQARSIGLLNPVSNWRVPYDFNDQYTNEAQAEAYDPNAYKSPDEIWNFDDFTTKHIDPGDISEEEADFVDPDDDDIRRRNIDSFKF
jgi:small subunit ribosomal protein S18